ncbi:hypothetical protein [Kallotenue papyrolyticum]|uniref:hypothetical protein n=1 Tax=Kallotenue papyrolyticum TaxID=1325125 RepID=UPI000478547A|nr:hypothetical protein [Kallotenue papyrolyticum]
MAVATELPFAGSAEEQALARRVYEVMVGQGALYGRDALIRQTLDNLAAFLAQQDGVEPAAMAKRIEAAVRANPEVFLREERDGAVLIATSRRGVARPRQEDRTHTFAQRLYEPARPLPVDDINNLVTMVRPPLTTVEPVQISGFWRALVSQQASAEPIVVPAAQPGPAESAPAEAAPAPATPTQPREEVSPTTILLSDGTPVDLDEPIEALMARFGAALQAEIAAALNEDPLRRVVNFGDLYYVADALPNLGKNDLRRIRDYIVEQGEPMSDEAILADVYRELPGSPSFEIRRFGLNYRLSREKDFEYVGMPGLNLWSAKGLAAIGSKRVKASDLGQFYAYLVDGQDDSEPVGDGTVMHYLTFFEWEYGVLPLNRAFASIMPRPFLPDQRAIAVHFESPQHYTTYLAEVRLPTATRGGWIWGLEDFFREYVVPGTLLTIAATEVPNVFTISYEEIPPVEDKLLHFEEKRNRFVFLPVTYYSAVDEDLLPSQKRYGKLRNLKALPMNDRKKADQVVAHVFETLGEQLGSKEEPMYWIQFNELLLGVNVLRPMSSAYLEQVLRQDAAYYADETTVGAWYYKPAPEEQRAEDESEAEDDEEE